MFNKDVAYTFKKGFAISRGFYKSEKEVAVYMGEFHKEMYLKLAEDIPGFRSDLYGGAVSIAYLVDLTNTRLTITAEISISDLEPSNGDIG